MIEDHLNDDSKLVEVYCVPSPVESQNKFTVDAEGVTCIHAQIRIFDGND